MEKYVDLSCQNCGSSIVVYLNQKTIKCKHCQSVHSINKEQGEVSIELSKRLDEHEQKIKSVETFSYSEADRSSIREWRDDLIRKFQEDEKKYESLEGYYTNTKGWDKLELNFHESKMKTSHMNPDLSVRLLVKEERKIIDECSNLIDSGDKILESLKATKAKFMSNIFQSSNIANLTSQLEAIVEKVNGLQRRLIDSLDEKVKSNRYSHLKRTVREATGR